jgi:phosphate-selective porin OprO/OprP
MKSRIAGAALAALVLLGGAPAAAQVAGLYFQEIEQDGRVYVFNTPERARTFRETGEIGTAITLVGRAEGGLTLVGENETAIDLYLFKHDLLGWERPTPKAERKFDDRVSWKDGKTTWEAKRGKVSLSNRVQTRYTSFDASNPAVEDRGTFGVRRAKTAIEAESADQKWKFKLQANWVGAGYLTAAALVPGSTPSLGTTTRRGPELEDAELWWQPKGQLFRLWVGQGKVPFGRQEFISSGRLQFVDRWLGNALYAPGRDQGVRIEGRNEARTWEYALGVYNGTARNTSLNDNDDYLVSGRAVWTPFGEYRLEESALDRPGSPKLALGAAFLDNTVGTGSSAIDVERLGYEVAFQWHGFSAQGEYFDETAERAGVETGNEGYYLQAGYLFPTRIEIAARVESIERDSAFSVANLGPALRDVEGTGFAVSYYFGRHVDKLQADYFTYQDDLTGLELDEFRLQLQVIF